LKKAPFARNREWVLLKSTDGIVTVVFSQSHAMKLNEFYALQSQKIGRERAISVILK